MPFKKKPLAIAVLSVLVLSQNSYAVNINTDIEYTGEHAEIIHVVDPDLAAGLILDEATVGILDIDIRKDKTIPDSVIILNSTVDTAFIENNGGTIAAVTKLNPAPEEIGLVDTGVVIAGSTVTGAFISERSETVLIDNRGTIQSAGVDAVGDTGQVILIKDSTVNGSILNNTPENDPLNSSNGARMLGDAESAIVILNSTFNGSIYNTDAFTSENEPQESDPLSAIVSDENGISIYQSTFNGSIHNSGYIEGRKWDEFEQPTNEGTALSIESSVFVGDINNSDRIIGGNRGINIYLSDFTGDINNSGVIAGGAGTNGRGISVNTSTFNGAINNTGDISGYRGVSITENVTGNLVFNQLAGSISGTDKAVILTDHRFNYTGGNINGKFANIGGTVYIEGNRTINGNYYQNADATLAFGLHKESSLTADNITLDAGSRILIDLTKGDLYIRNGSSVELLKVKENGAISASGISYSVNNSLVTIGEISTNEKGNVVVTFVRESIVDIVKASSGVTGQARTNTLAVMTQLETLASTNPAISNLLNQLNLETAEDTAGILPDVSGASVGSAGVASRASGGVVSSRTRAISAGDTFVKSGFWLQGLFADAKQNTTNGISGYDAKTHGLVLGIDGETDNGSVYGIAYTYTKTDSDTLNKISHLDSAYHQVTGYWGYTLGNVLMDGQVFYGQGDNEARRSATGGVALGDYDITQYGVLLSSGYQVNLNNGVQVTPRASLDYARLETDAYSESGSALGLLNINKQKLNRLEAGVSVDASKTFQVEQILVTPRVTLGAFHDFEAEAQSVTSAFQAAPTSTFTLQGADVDSTRYVAGIGVEIAKGDNFTATAEYNYNWKSEFDAHAGALKLRWEF